MRADFAGGVPPDGVVPGAAAAFGVPAGAAFPCDVVVRPLEASGDFDVDVPDLDVDVPALGAVAGAGAAAGVVVVVGAGVVVAAGAGAGDGAAGACASAAPASVIAIDAARMRRVGWNVMGRKAPY